MDVTGVTRIAKIGIRHGASIDSLIIHYERNGHEESTDIWGGQGGQLTEVRFIYRDFDYSAMYNTDDLCATNYFFVFKV
jgi:hypothetical protein